MADGGLCGKNLMWWLEDNGTLTISGRGEMYDYSDDYGNDIPWHNNVEFINKIVIEQGVTSIGNGAFVDCESLTIVTIPDSVISIGEFAFSWCAKLTNVTIPDSVVMIGVDAFNYCTSLTSVTIPSSVMTISDFAFCWCDSLTSVTIPDSVKSIGDGVFFWCTSLKEIHYPAGRGFEKQLSMGNNAKLIPYNVTPTTQPVTRLKPTAQPVAEKLTWSFAGKTLTVGDVREIKFFPYSKLPWLKHLHDIQRIVVGDGVEKIAAQAFEECKRLELVTLPASVKTIGDMAFSVSFCGSINGIKNVFWCLEDGVLVLKKNPDVSPAADFSTGSISWVFAEKNIRSIKIEDGVKPTGKFFEWMVQRFNGKEISFGE